MHFRLSFTILTTISIYCSILVRRGVAFSIRHRRCLITNTCLDSSTRVYSASTSTFYSDDSMFKRAKLEVEQDNDKATKTIGTHSGTFQADEAMGCWMLRQLPLYRHSKIVRSRDPIVLDTLDIVIDVGGIYSHAQLKYDHHQRDYDERFDDKQLSPTIAEKRCTKLSACGLVYRHYGKQVIQQHYPQLPPNLVDLAYTNLYDTLLEALDAIDTGVEAFPDGIKPLYTDSTGLSSRVKRLNIRWNEETNDTEDDRFAQAMQMCGHDFMDALIHIVESDLPARDIVEQAVLNRSSIHDSGQIIKLESGGLPWKRHLYDLESIHNIVEPQSIKFVLYEDSSKMWRIQCVSVQDQPFTNRLSLPEAWRGVRDQDLEGVCGIKGARFVHASGFIGGASTYEGVLEMAQTALKQ